jgi:hypothetical protein
MKKTEFDRIDSRFLVSILPNLFFVKRTFLPFLAMKLGHFKEIVLFSYVTKGESLTAQIEKQRI